MINILQAQMMKKQSFFLFQERLQLRNDGFVFGVIPQYWDFYSYIKTPITNIGKRAI